MPPVTIDFETFAILPRPDYPPKPVGVAIRTPGKAARYYAWGHPTANNCTIGQGRAALEAVWKCQDGLLFQNAKFDLDVANKHFKLARPAWHKIHDTMLLLFLDDPHQKELSLKPAAERLLGMPPGERDAVADWLIEHQPIPGIKISRAPKSEHYFAKYIAYAPGDLVGKYACGDVIRTEKIFALLLPKTIDRQMAIAYDRERRLLPVIMGMEAQGVPVDVKRLGQDIANGNDSKERLEAWLKSQLKAKELNLDSGAELVEALLKVGKVDKGKLGVTPTGKPQTNKEALEAGITDRRITACLKYRTQLSTCLQTFMEPWLATAKRSNGLIFTSWNQVRSPKGGDGNVGTRTGRLSSTPNFQNIPKTFAPIFKQDAPAEKLPISPIPLNRLPLVRSYIVPWDADSVLLDRDYSQQELRILGHFEDGVLKQAYLDNPWLDVHDYARTLINQMTGKNFDRKPIKNTGFGIIYGMGVGLLAERSGIDVQTAAEVRKAYKAIFPGLKAMDYDMRMRAQGSLPIRTWGGREYYCEPPAIVKGQMRTFEYKMLNVLIQGSAADCTKEAMIIYNEKKPADHRLLLTVHDEILVSSPRKKMADAMALMKECMESIQFDVQMLSEGTWSDTNWAELKPFDEKGNLLWRGVIRN